MRLTELRSRIGRREAVVGVIGLGYVGLPVACTFAEAGFRVIGLDVKAERVAKINAGISPIEGEEPGLADLLTKVVGKGNFKATTDYGELSEADVVLIDVDTPIDEDHRPSYAALKAACSCLEPVLKQGALVVVESTIGPGTIAAVVRPLIEATGKRLDLDFHLGACPERVMPGKLLTNLPSMSRVCGGSTKETAAAMVALYRNIVQAELDLADCVTAELVKTAENAYRDVNIAFANELALICEATGGDFMRVRELVNKSPGRNVLLAGAGVGGHCIPKDPWLLISSTNGTVTPRLIPTAREVNDSMPLHVAEITVQALREAGRDIAGSRLAVLGYAYLEDSDDTRNSPSEVLVARLRQLGAEVVVHDPWVTEYQGDIRERLEGCDAAIVMVAHRQYRDLDLSSAKRLLRTPILIDGRHVFDIEKATAAGLVYRGLGKGTQPA